MEQNCQLGDYILWDPWDWHNLPTFMIDSPLKTTIHVAKYTVRPMDPMAMLPTRVSIQVIETS